MHGKYFDEEEFPTLAVLDFELSETQVGTMLSEGLELVARHERYSARELIGTLFALKRPELRANENRLAHGISVHCSAFVQRLFSKIGLDLAPGMSRKHTTSEDVSRSPQPHVKYPLLRGMSGLRTNRLHKRISAGLRSQIQKSKPEPAKS